jgi:hypothetical protein
MAKKKTGHILNAENDGSYFQRDYFPREFHYLRDAKLRAQEALDHGCTNVTVNGKTFPGGIEGNKE